MRMTVNVYKSQLKKQLDSLKNFKSGTEIEFIGHNRNLPAIDFDRMKYNEENAKTKYRAVDSDGHFAEWGNNNIIEHDSIERLASSIAYHYHRSAFDLKVKDPKLNLWRDPTKYESKLFDKELDSAFTLDEWH